MYLMNIYGVPSVLGFIGLWKYKVTNAVIGPELMELWNSWKKKKLNHRTLTDHLVQSFYSIEHKTESQRDINNKK